MMLIVFFDCLDGPNHQKTPTPLGIVQVKAIKCDQSFLGKL